MDGQLLVGWVVAGAKGGADERGQLVLLTMQVEAVLQGPWNSMVLHSALGAYGA